MTAALRIDPLVRAAFMAGRGYSADEISAEVGAPANAISAALSLYDLRLDAKPFGARLFGVRVARDHLRTFESAARARGVDIPEMLRRILSVVGRGEISLDAVLDDRLG